MSLSIGRASIGPAGEDFQVQEIDDWRYKEKHGAPQHGVRRTSAQRRTAAPARKARRSPPCGSLLASLHRHSTDILPGWLLPLNFENVLTANHCSKMSAER